MKLITSYEFVHILPKAFMGFKAIQICYSPGITWMKHTTSLHIT